MSSGDSSDSDDDDFGAIGFMFNTATSKVTRTVEISTTLSVRVRCIDDKPGALQSGQFLWPGASVLGAYLESHASQLPSSPDLLTPSAEPSTQPHRILELGAGCGLVGLACTLLAARGAFAVPFGTVVLTDHDPGTLSLVREAVALLPETPGSPSSSFPVECLVESLEWGQPDALQPAPFNGGFSLVVASDVFYSDTVVFPLLSTVASCLLSPASLFLMMTSIEEPPDIQAAIAAACAGLQLSHHATILQQHKTRIFRLHHFRLLSLTQPQKQIAS
ncbi:MAG: hypothetical protein Q8P67_03360 [archaeon]|nr:hypothetical protein [archaeon]